MKFLLNSKVEIISFRRVEEENGAFVESSSSLGMFFCQIHITKKLNEEILTLILRENEALKAGDFRVIFDGETYNCLNVTEITEGFLKIICRK
jgi:hypothetical protein